MAQRSCQPALPARRYRRQHLHSCAELSTVGIAPFRPHGQYGEKKRRMIDSRAGSVVIAGGGIIGAGIAYELARRGVPVTLVERGRIGGEASGASAGIVSLPSRPWMKPERVELGRISLEHYPALVAELEERTGLAI